jgi:DNA-binding transcriptional MerR regulator
MGLTLEWVETAHWWRAGKETLVFKIGEFSRLSMVPVTALRYYADSGLVSPGWIDPDTGYRYYTADQLPRINRVLALKDLGLSLDEIRAILDEHLSPAELRGMLRLKRAEIGRRVAEEQERLARVESRLRLIEKEGAMPEEEVVVKDVESQHGLAMREVLAVAKEIGPFIQDGFAALGMGGIPPVGPPAVMYHDPEFTGEDLDVELFIPVAQSVGGPVPTPAGRELTKQTLCGGTVARLVHVGPYETIGEAYQTLAGWIGEHGHAFAGPPQELYLSDPAEGGPPVTEIRWPIAASEE